MHLRKTPSSAFGRNVRFRMLGLVLFKSYISLLSSD